MWWRLISSSQSRYRLVRHHAMSIPTPGILSNPEVNCEYGSRIMLRNSDCTHIRQRSRRRSEVKCTSLPPPMSGSGVPCRWHCRNGHQEHAEGNRLSSQTRSPRAGSIQRCHSGVSQHVILQGNLALGEPTSRPCSRQTAVSHLRAKGPCC